MGDVTQTIKTQYQNLASLGTVLDLIQPHPIHASVAYTHKKFGPATIPDGGVATDPVAIDFGTVTEAYAFTIQNTCSQELVVKINGSAALFSMMPGAILSYVTPAAAVTTPITALSVLLTASQTGDEQIQYSVFGI